MKILVMGGTGAIGKELVSALEQNKNNTIFVTSRRANISTDNVKYIMGNAKNLDFIYPLIKDGSFDIIIDFMLYSPNEFRERYKFFLNACDQYIFFSSARVYAPSEKRIDEEAARLFDISRDKEYLESREYSLVKAEEEDILKNDINDNWVIIRPYKIYNDNRLQLGVFEMEQWLHRAMTGKTVVVPGDIKNLHTSLTYSKDVAKILIRIIGDKCLNGEIIQIANPESMTWGDVIDIYSQCIERHCGRKMSIYYAKDTTEIELKFKNKYRIKYDGLIERSFDDKKICCLMQGQFHWTPIREGLKICVDAAIKQNQDIMPDYGVEGMFDRLTGEHISLKSIPNNKQRLKYLLHRIVSEQVIYRVKNHW